MNPAQFTGHPAHNMTSAHRPRTAEQMREYANSLKTIEVVKEAIRDEEQAFDDQSEHINRMQESLKTQVGIAEGIECLFNDPTQQVLGTHYETYGATKHRIVLMQRTIEMAVSQRVQVADQVVALQERLKELEQE